jgi:hypothetical protein
MATLLLIGLVIAVLFLAGWGPTLLLLERGQKYPRLVAVPVVGLACYIVAAHLLAGWGLTGRPISWICTGVFGALAVLVPRDRRLSRQEVREALGPLGICIAGLLFTTWPLLYEGYHSYLAFGNPDAAFNLAVYEDLQGHGYAAPRAGSVRFWPNAQFGHVFGIGYLGVLIALLTGADILKLHEVTSASLVFAAPASVFLFCLLGLKTRTRSALVAMGVSAVSSLVCYTYYLQSMGAMTLIALLPALVGVWSAALESGRKRLVLLSALLFTGASFGYYASLPVAGLLLASAALSGLAKRTIGVRALAGSAAMVVAVILVSFPVLTLEIIRRTAVEATSSRLRASLEGPEVLLSFAFVLTEQFLPFFWGLLIPPMAWDSLFAPPAWGFLFVLGVSVLLLAVLARILAKPVADTPLPVRVQIGLLLGVVLYFIFRDNGYGVFKLAAWINPLVLAFLVCGVLPAAAPVASRRFRPRLHWVLVPLVGLNLVWSVRLGAASLHHGGPSGKSMSGFTGADFDSLRDLSRHVNPQSRILVAIPDPVVQRWVITYLRRFRLSAVPYLSFSPEEPDAWEQVAAEDAASASYILTWSGNNNDVVSYLHLRSLWRSGKFQLVRRDVARNLLVVGKGWYRVESIPGSSYPWQHRFRWLRSNGELLLFEPGDEWLRLRLVVVPGFGRRDPARSFTLSVNGEEFDRIAITGFGAVISKPFRAQGFPARLSLALDDRAEPLPRPWGLFNKWVPKDGRRLNVAISKIEVLTDQDYQRLRLPCRLDLSQPDAWDAPFLAGVYPDGWIAEETRVTLRHCTGSDAISLHGFVPGISGSLFPLSITASVNGMTLPPAELVQAGDFTVTLPLPPELRTADPLEFRFRPSQSFVPGGSEHRKLSALLRRIELVRQPMSDGLSRPKLR